MTRPDTHRPQQPAQSCASCRLARLVAYKLDLLCFHGDDIEVAGQSQYPVTADHVYFHGEEVGSMDGDEYDNVWANRIVEPDDICDEWESECNE